MLRRARKSDQRRQWRRRALNAPIFVGHGWEVVIRSREAFPNPWLFGLGTSASAGLLQYLQPGSITGSNSLFAAGTITPTEKPALIGSGSLYAPGSIAAVTGPVLPGSHSLFAPGIIVPAIKPSLPGVGSLFSTGTVTVTGAGAQFTVVQAWRTTEAAAGAAAISQTISAPTVGNLVIVGVITGSGVTGVTIADNQSHTFTLTPNSPFPSSRNELAVGWWVASGTPGTVISATWGSGTSTYPADIWVIELAGNAASPFEIDAGTTNVSETNVILPSLTTVNDGDYLISLIRVDTAVSTANTPWTLSTAIPASTNACSYYLQATHGPQAVAYTTTTAGTNDCLVVAFKNSGGGGSSPVTGALAVTLGPDTLSASGTVSSGAVTGALAVTLGADTLTASGTVSSGAPFSVVQPWGTNEAAAGVSSISYTLPSNPTVGNLVIVGISTGSGVTGITITDNQSHTYTLTPNSPFGASSDEVAIGWWVASGTPGNVITATWGSGTSTYPADIWAIELTGNSASPFETDAGTTNTSETNVILPSVTTGNNGDYIVSVIRVDGAVTSANSPWTLSTAIPASTNACDYYLQPSSGTRAVAYTTTSGGNDCIVAAFKNSGGGSGPASTSITATPVTGLVAPVSPGTVLYNCTVAPSNWTGSVGLSGTPADMVVGTVSTGSFTIVVGASSLGAGTYSGGTITTTP